MFYRKLLSTSLLVGGLLTATVANAQNINSLETRLNRLENEMQTMSRAMFRGDVPPPQYAAPQDLSNAAAMEMRLGQIEEQLQRLTGRVEETQYQIRQMEERLQTLSSQATTSVQPSATSPYVNDYDSSVVTDTPSNTVTEQPYQLGTLNSGTATPAALYDEAFSYLQRNDYQAAENAFSEFTTRYPDHSLVSNAKYWLGETYYARGDYAGASRAFARAFQDHSDSQKAPDMLLKLGMSLAQQDKKDEACLTLAELKKRYPSGPASVMKTADDERRSLGCDS